MSRRAYFVIICCSFIVWLSFSQLQHVSETRAQGTVPTSNPTPILFDPTPISAQPTPTPIALGDPNSNCDSNPWQFTANMTTMRGGHSAIVVGNDLYVIGGGVGDMYSEMYAGIERAVIQTDGTLSDWQRVGALSSPRVSLASVMSGDYIYVLGGRNPFRNPSNPIPPSNNVNLVERAKVNADGSLGEWQEMASLTQARSTLAAVATHEYIYAIGGESGSGGSTNNIVERGKINPDQTLADWEVLTPLPNGRKGHVALVNGNYLYVMGGYAGNDMRTVVRAAISADGTLGAWQTLTSITTERIEPMGVTDGKYIYLLGGHTTASVYQNSVERAKINPDGSLNAWEIAYPMHLPRWGGVGVLHDNRLYAIGGGIANDKSGSSATVEWVDLINLVPPPNFSLSINDGALYTNRIAVTLSISGPPTNLDMQVSNDGGFTEAVWERCTRHKLWEITQLGNYVIPRVVYIRYKDKDGKTSSTFQDDIILDVTPPTGSVTIANLTGISAANASVTLIVSASDDVSGIAGMRISNRSDFLEADWQRYQTSYLWSFDSAPTVYVQLRDNAGNTSNTYSASIVAPIPTSTALHVHLPLVAR